MAPRSLLVELRGASIFAQLKRITVRFHVREARICMWLSKGCAQGLPLELVGTPRCTCRTFNFTFRQSEYNLPRCQMLL